MQLIQITEEEYADNYLTFLYSGSIIGNLHYYNYIISVNEENKIFCYLKDTDSNSKRITDFYLLILLNSEDICPFVLKNIFQDLRYYINNATHVADC